MKNDRVSEGKKSSGGKIEGGRKKEKRRGKGVLKMGAFSRFEIFRSSTQKKKGGGREK